jgi:ABC-2 type transport system ATP-binding protein
MLYTYLQFKPNVEPVTSSPGQVVIGVEHYTRTFGTHTAINDLSLEVHAGEIFGFLGHNGAGKTTTVRLLNGLLQPTSGFARVLGFDPVTQGAKLRRQTGVLTETPSLDNRMTAYENLAMYAAMYSLPNPVARARINELLTIFGLEDRSKDRVAGFSKGMKQRLALARALVHQPDLIFLDEPASGLDPVVTRQLHELILHLSRNEGKTIFLCTHNLGEAQKLCQRVAVLQQGHLLALGTPSELARNIVSEISLKVEIEPTDVNVAMAVLARFTSATPTLDAAGISVAGIRRDQIPEVLAALVAEAVRVYRVDHDEPTLEDVYFALHTTHNGVEERVLV